MQNNIEYIITTLKDYDNTFNERYFHKAIDLITDNIHPDSLKIVKILIDLHLDMNSIIAALLYNQVQNNLLTLNEINKNFYPEILHIIQGVIKISNIKFLPDKMKIINNIENFRKLLLAITNDIRIIIIKLAAHLVLIRKTIINKELKLKKKILH